MTRAPAVLFAFLLAACAGFPANLPYTPPTYIAYRCAKGPGFEAKLGDGRVLILWDGQRATLPRVDAASGEKYTDGTVLYWSKGCEAMLETPEVSWRGCRGQVADTVWRAAAVRGVDLRASGNEPPWLVEIDWTRESRVVLDYGKTVLKGPPPRSREAPLTLPIPGHTVTLETLDAVCRDSMSGKILEFEMRLTVDGTAYRGCGQRLGDPFGN